MNCVMVLNAGEYMSANARASIRCAARRWKADYVEVQQNPLPHLHPCFSKATTLLRLGHYSRIAYFDADMLIRGDAPSCFETFPEAESFYAVSDISVQRIHLHKGLGFNIINWVRQPYYSPAKSALNSSVSYERYAGIFFNGGFFICNPRFHRALFHQIEASLPQPGHCLCQNAHYEQALLNLAVQTIAADTLVLVDETWNYIDPDISKPLMNHYVYHFTGANHKILKPAITGFPWMV
jgi:lipopolysaccharide biosynthesis glycosyltransferase